MPSSAYTLTVVIIPDTFSPAPSTSTMKTPENTEDNLNDPERADEGDIQIEHSSD
jgi:hypothetical protein